ncbi:Type I phosphodiesterase / nucleotide pyrophosphatase [Gimesia alba]|uniref:Type I phosphodiesterase / nucleotide pyrophosphatase n=1 Tax=Gimesia alba TaxID=2527973 RepID=A0A517R9V5_9PLAN|nr:nucleotide pyrophosphatase/phosphodiesterase family protein [Gimesia alba]QDT40656.1 Type I phosphodiesterase / nucleotide pyrophosphatase [Gimesia alba]
MVKPLVVINIVGLTHAMLGDQTPHLARLADQGFSKPMGTVLPAVTCSAQSTLLTGLLPRDHGVVANGWYFRELSEVMFWKQSNKLVHGERVYEAAKHIKPDYTTAKMFWWYNMYAPVEWSVTPRPSYPADGRKVFDSYSQPESLKDELQSELGVFPLLKFWGPGADISSSRWIVDASIQVFQDKKPDLTLVYLPHLDYNLQRLGVNDSSINQDIRDIDHEAGRLIQVAQNAGAEVVVLSEYAITDVSKPIHINRILREHGWLQVRKEALGWETLDCGASAAFGVADHQLAHVYIENPHQISDVKSLLEKVDGIEMVLDQSQQVEFGIDHARSGELVVVAAPGAWFTYYFWLDDRVAPDYARTVDIHRKPGYDPVELFIDPQIRFPKLRIARRLAQKKLGFRYYMDLTSLDANLVKGSHGRLPTPGKEETEAPVFISSSKMIERDEIPMTVVKELLLELQFGK